MTNYSTHFLSMLSSHQLCGCLLTICLLMFPFSAITSAQTTESLVIYGASTSSHNLVILHLSGSQDSEFKKIDCLPVPLGFPSDAVLLHPDKKLLYVADLRANQSSTAKGACIKLHPNGKIAEMHPFYIKHGYSYLSFDRNQKYLLGASYFEGYVDVYPLGENGLPGDCVSSVFSNRDKAHAVLTSPDNKNVYIPFVKDQNYLAQYQFDQQTGKLTPLNPTGFVPQQNSGPRHLAYHPTLPLVYFSNEQHIGVSVYKMNHDGTLTLVQMCEAGIKPGSPGFSASDIVLTADSRWIYIGQRNEKNTDNSINRFKVLEDGQLKFEGSTPTDHFPWGLEISPDNKHLFVSCTISGTLINFKINADGSLTQIQKFTTENNDWQKNIPDFKIYTLNTN